MFCLKEMPAECSVFFPVWFQLTSLLDKVFDLIGLTKIYLLISIKVNKLSCF